MDTDDAMGAAMHAAALKRLMTPGVTKYLQSIAREHIEGGFEDDEEDYEGERIDLWSTFNQEEKDTANHLTDAIFDEWL